MALRLLFECDWRPFEVARELDVSDGTVSQWKHRHQQGREK
jgi:transposase-like protein